MDKTLDLDELERVAREATPGPWQVYQHAMTPFPELHDVVGATRDDDVAENLPSWIAAYIATFDPPTILTLIAAARPAETRDWSEFEDEISDAISDSIDMDWSSRDGARAVVAYLKQIGAKLP